MNISLSAFSGWRLFIEELSASLFWHILVSHIWFHMIYFDVSKIQFVVWYSRLVSLYPASVQCQVLRMYPGGCKEIYFQNQGMIHSMSPWKIKYEACAWLSGKKWFFPLCAIFHKALCIFLLKKKKMGMNDMMGNGKGWKSTWTHLTSKSRSKTKTKVSGIGRY